MRITTVSLTYQRTQSFTGSFSNIKPTCTLTAEVETGEDPQVILEQLNHIAQDYVHSIIDDALEQENEPPKFYQGPRYGLCIHSDDGYIALIPDRSLPQLSPEWKRCLKKKGYRYDYLLSYIDDFATDLLLSHLDSYHFIDCRDGDLSQLPLLEQFEVYYYRDYILLFPRCARGDHLDSLPEYWQRPPGRPDKPTRIRENLVTELEAEAREKQKTFINLLDLDFSRLPDLPQDGEDGISF